MKVSRGPNTDQKGFTLVELLIVMAIIAVLVGITIAGLGYAMRRSRNIARMSAMTNLERALTSYYSDNLAYPATASDVLTDLIDDDLDQYLEGSWEAPAGTIIYYQTGTGTGTTPIYFTICVNQEQSGGAVDSYNCTGPGIGQTTSAFPDETNDVACDDGTPANGGDCGNYSEFGD